MSGVKKKAQFRIRAALSDKRKHLDSIEKYVLDLARQLNSGEARTYNNSWNSSGRGASAPAGVTGI
jgi:hypothetical protein